MINGRICRAGSAKYTLHTKQYQAKDEKEKNDGVIALCIGDAGCKSFSEIVEKILGGENHFGFVADIGSFRKKNLPDESQICNDICYQQDSKGEPGGKRNLSFGMKRPVCFEKCKYSEYEQAGEANQYQRGGGSVKYDYKVTGKAAAAKNPRNISERGGKRALIGIFQGNFAAEK